MPGADVAACLVRGGREADLLDGAGALGARAARPRSPRRRGAAPWSTGPWRGDAGAVVEPAADRARQRDLVPVRVAPRVAALAEALDRAVADLPADAAELLVALHPARLHHRLAPAVLGRRRQCFEGQIELEFAGAAHGPALERHLGRRRSARPAARRRPRRSHPACRARRARPRARWRTARRPRSPPTRDPREPVQPGAVVGPRERDRVRVPGLAQRPRGFEVCGAHRGGGSMSTAVPSMSRGRPLGGLAVPGIDVDQLEHAAADEQPAHAAHASAGSGTAGRRCR